MNIMILKEDRKLWCRDTKFLLKKNMRNATYIIGVISNLELILHPNTVESTRFDRHGGPHLQH